MSIARLVRAAGFCVAVAAAGIARADGSENLDEVTLKDGGSIRGTVVSVEPGTQVKLIEMGSKEVRTIPWSQVADVEKGKYTPEVKVEPRDAGPGYAGPPPGEAPIRVDPAAPVAPKYKVHLHVDSPEAVTITAPYATGVMTVDRQTGAATRQGSVCESPCDIDILFNDGDIFIARGDFPGKKAFRLMRLGDAAELSVKPGSYGKLNGGIVATVVGFAALAAGTVFTIFGTRFGLSSDSRNFYAAGGSLMIGGAGLGALGIWGVVTGTTKWNLHPANAQHDAAIEPWIGVDGARDVGAPSAVAAGVKGAF